MGTRIEPQISPLNVALQFKFKVTITQQTVRDSGYVQYDHITYSRDITYGYIIFF